MKFGVIGFGSIGRRHAKNLKTLGYHDTILLREIGAGNDLGLREVNRLEALFDNGVDQVIVSNPTSMHMSTLKSIMVHGVNILAEKPLLALPEEVAEFRSVLSGYSGKGMVAYNMRFHPCIQEVEKILSRGYLGRIYSARLFVGQYLPDWRPERDYRETYSARKELGGGVALDLIHEIDLAQYLFGKPARDFHAVADHVSDLEIDTEDLVEIHFQTEGKSFISIHMDYLTRGYRRDIQVQCEKGNLYVDLGKATIELADEQGKTRSWAFQDFKRNDMYLDLLRSFREYSKRGEMPSPSFEEGLISNEIAFKAREDFYSG